MINLLIFGAPGAGKGTQAEKIAEKYHLNHISTGDLFRKNIKEKTELGQRASDYISHGKLVPDQLVVDMVEDYLDNNPSESGYIFDGFPRTVFQAQALDGIMESRDGKVSGMIALEVPHEELIARIKNRAKTSGRVDDMDENKINTRIGVYESETKPVAEFYNGKGIYSSIEGVGTIEEIFAKICEVIDQY